MTKLARMLKARANAWALQREEEIARSDLHEDLLGSKVHSGPESLPARDKKPVTLGLEMEPLPQQVTLIVYGWHNVQPGRLSWVFPSVRHAITAAKAMRNAVCWAIVRGRQRAEGLDDARARGLVLLEHAG
jgi:hypothetical protein